MADTQVKKEVRYVNKDFASFSESTEYSACESEPAFATN